LIECLGLDEGLFRMFYDCCDVGEELVVEVVVD